MNFNIRNIISTVINWASAILLGRLVLFVVAVIVAIGINFWSGHQNYVHDRELYGIQDTVQPSYVFNNRGCMMRFSEGGVLEAIKLQVAAEPKDCIQIPNAAEIIKTHKENARGINRPGSVGWQVFLAGVLGLMIFYARTGSRSESSHSIVPMLIMWVALFPVTFGAIYTDYTSITKSNYETYRGYVTTVYPATNGKWYPLPHTKIAKHAGGHVHIATDYTL